MKTHYKLFVFLTLLFGTGCSRVTDPLSGIAVTVMVDITDNSIYHITGADLFNRCYPDDSQFEELWLSIYPISDIRLTPQYICTIPRQSFLFGNSTLRARDIKRYENTVDTMLQKLYSDQQELHHSRIMIPLARCAKELMKRTEKERFLIVDSDLMENTEAWNCYAPGSMRQVKEDPKKVLKKMLQGEDFPDVRGLTVYLLHMPGSVKDDDQYWVMSDFFRNVLEEHGARVIVFSNL